MKPRDITDLFNFRSRGRALEDFTITLARPDGDPAKQADAFRLRLTRWLQRQGDDFKGNAEKPQVIAPSNGYARLSLRCTEETALRIERQFAGDILKVSPPAPHQRGTIYPPKVDPFDISKW